MAVRAAIDFGLHLEGDATTMRKVYETATIYALIDPITEEVRYIGTTVNLKQRLIGHLAEAYQYAKYLPSCSCNEPKQKWVYSLIQEKIKPIISHLETVPISQSHKCERYWIQHFMGNGATLFNIHNTPEWVKKSDARKLLVESRPKRKTWRTR